MRALGLYRSASKIRRQAQAGHSFCQHPQLMFCRDEGVERDNCSSSGKNRRSFPFPTWKKKANSSLRRFVLRTCDERLLLSWILGSLLYPMKTFEANKQTHNGHNTKIAPIASQTTQQLKAIATKSKYTSSCHDAAHIGNEGQLHLLGKNRRSFPLPTWRKKAKSSLRRLVIRTCDDFFPPWSDDVDSLLWPMKMTKNNASRPQTTTK